MITFCAALRHRRLGTYRIPNLPFQDPGSERSEFSRFLVIIKMAKFVSIVRRIHDARAVIILFIARWTRFFTGIGNYRQFL